MADEEQNTPPEEQPADATPATDGASPTEGTPEAGAEAALDAAQAAADQLNDIASGDPAPVDLPQFGSAQPGGPANGIERLSHVNLNVRIELGRTRMFVDDVLRLNEGAVVELDKLAGDPVDIYVNDRHVACGEVLVLNDTFCVRVSEIISSPKGETEQR